ncbi:MAG: 1-(5-phosphoribosyl)-5-[(5-phosphoribosylamino)methylideneamino]imidazole-4-carboxamide isomerase [Promethearchaeota archaeon]
MNIEIIPAIDISQGKCVRLYKGKKGTEKIYYENPLDVLDFWINQNAKRLHFIDLDGAWGSNRNKEILKQMIKKASDRLKVQIGGGIRNFESAKELIEIGADRVIIGTLAIKHPSIIQKLVNEFGSEHVIVALDYKKNRIAIQGWTEQTDIDPFIFGKKIEDLGAGFILFSSIEADGTFTGPDINNIKIMVNSVKIPIYAAGGIRDEKDIIKLEQLGVWGVIIGKAFYEQTIPYSILKNPKYDC